MASAATDERRRRRGQCAAQAKPRARAPQARPERGNNVPLYVESAAERETRRLTAQRTALRLAARATAILREQQRRDPHVLDLRPYAGELDDALLSELAAQLQANAAGAYEALVLSGCADLTPVGLRALVHVVGASLRRLDCSRTALSVATLQVLASGLRGLDALDLSGSPRLASDGLRELLSCCSSSLTRLNLSRCAAVTDDALGWLAGALGPQGARTRCRRLLSLDVARSTAISDRGLEALGAGCRLLQFLNLEGLSRLSPGGVLHVARGCRALRVLCLRRCPQLSDATLAHIGRHCGQLRSLDLGGCYALSSAGLRAMAPGTPRLQTLRLDGCLHMREDVLAVLATSCPALQTLDVTGCQDMTDDGLATLAHTLPFVQRARVYRGLEPRSDSLERKLSVQQQTIRGSAALRLQAFYRGHLGRRVAASWRHEVLERPAGRRIRRAYTSWRLRDALQLRVARTSLVRRSAVRIQSLVRGVLARVALARARMEHERLALSAVWAVKVQAAYRGHWTRRHAVLVRKAMERYRLEQLLLRRDAAATRLQRGYRARFARSRFQDVLLLNQRRRRERAEAAVTLQRLFRTRAARRAYRMLREAVARQQEELRELARLAVRLQSNWRGRRSRQHELARVRAEAQRREARRGAAATRLNAAARGYFGRRDARRERVRMQTRLRAARVIQRAWRVYKTPNAERLQYDAMLQRLRESRLQEDAAAHGKQLEILRLARERAERDSASEPESDDDWRDVEDERGDQLWFSPSRNARLYMRPNEHAREKSVLGMPCRVLWPLEQRWFDGHVTRYNWRKDRHRVDYDDGDHEWLRLFHADASRVQLFNGHCWCLAPMLEPSRRALRAAVFLRVCFQRFDTRLRCWRSGSIQAYHEPSDTFLLAYDAYDSGSGGAEPQEQEWADVFGSEDHFQVQDAGTRQWYSLSGFVFGHSRGRPLDLLGSRRLQGQADWYSVADYLEYDEEAFALEEQAPEEEVVAVGTPDEVDLDEDEAPDDEEDETEGPGRDESDSDGQVTRREDNDSEESSTDAEDDESPEESEDEEEEPED